MVCFNLTQIYIHFGSSIHVGIESPYSLVDTNGKERFFNVYPVSSDNEILQFLDKKVRSVAINKTRTNFCIRFEDNTSINLIGDNSYESYRIKINERIIIV